MWLASMMHILIGFAVGAQIVGEQSLLLKYSAKDEREKNLGFFRAFYGIGALIAPPMCAGLYAWGEFFAIFLTCGIIFIVLAPIIYNRL